MDREAPSLRNFRRFDWIAWPRPPRQKLFIGHSTENLAIVEQALKLWVGIEKVVGNDQAALQSTRLEFLRRRHG